MRITPTISLARRIFGIFHILILSLIIVWFTNGVESSARSMLPYLLFALVAWDFTRILTVRAGRKRKQRAKHWSIEKARR